MSGIQLAVHMGSIQREQHECKSPPLHREEIIVAPSAKAGDQRLPRWEHYAECLRFQDQVQLLQQILHPVHWQLQHSHRAGQWQGSKFRNKISVLSDPRSPNMKFGNILFKLDHFFGSKIQIISDQNFENFGILAALIQMPRTKY